MRLGIDFGTTRTIVAQVDRGNYPVVTFFDTEGDPHDYFPSVVACRDGILLFGFEAQAAAADGAPLLRSVKRTLAAPDVTMDTPVRIGSHSFAVAQVISGFLAAVREALTTASSLTARGLAADAAGATLSAVVAVPAHAHGTQRFLTLDAFRRAGFTVLAMMNEPSAAGFEYTHRQGRTLNSKRTRVIVYDLGGGTFDASLIRGDGTDHEVLGSLGLNHLGGDDFDHALAETAIGLAGVAHNSLNDAAYALLLDECREVKEHLSPQTKRLVVDVADLPVTVPVADFAAASTPLVEATIEAMRPLIGGLDSDAPELTDVAGIYLVGGASTLPLVSRLLKARFGRRVFRSPYPAASTAIGLAIAADPDAGYSLTDRLSRGFGVFREASAGRSLHFDEIITRDEALSATRDVVITRRYPAAHNIGWFRFVEYSALDASGQPKGDLVPFAEVVFPFDPHLETLDEPTLRGHTVSRIGHGPMIEERYAVDRYGIVSVTITNLDTGHRRTHSLGLSGATQSV